MKALKNDYTAYVEQIGQAVTDYYAKSAEPSNSELMRLYSVIGRCICAQGEKAFVVYLAEILAVRFSQIKGFSPRNLRRMRDFYRTYENRPDLMCKVQALGWTQNSVILECCENNEQREFYIDCAIDRNLSKLSLMREIETGAYKQTHRKHTDMDKGTNEMSEPVSDAPSHPSVDKAPAINAACGPFVTACEPPCQGDGMPYRMETNNSDITRRNCVVKDRNEKPAVKLIDTIRFFKTERMLGVIYSWLRRVDYTLTYERFRIGIWIGDFPPGRWRCPWQTADWILHST
jgi:hypothetical protein